MRTMRLASTCKLVPGGGPARSEAFNERHRHRYEFNNSFREIFVKNGFSIAGLSPDENLVEIVELNDHPWFVGVQFHPEFKSRPNRAPPLFREFIRSALEYGKAR